MFKVTVWEKELLCPACPNDVWHQKIVKIVDFDDYLAKKEIEEVRYLFECTKCGYGMWFGMMTDWERDINNLIWTPIDETNSDKI